MRCPQCGFDCQSGAAFCSRCGARLDQPKPASVREYSIALVRRSWWYYVRGLFFGGLAVLVGVVIIFEHRDAALGGLTLVVLGFAVWGAIPLRRHSTKWLITSDRLMEQRGILATVRREVELQDIRSIEVSRTLAQRLLRLGDVMVASAASADFLIRLGDVHDPDGVAETVRKARLRRLG
jgi:uncharacterized membrane protein YdbT with pleckstrin-like domain